MPGTHQIGLRWAGIMPQGKLAFSEGAPATWCPSRQAEMVDHFGHPQGVQVKALNSEFGFHPSYEPLSIY